MTEDEEIAAMKAIASALEPLDPSARKRTLLWALSRFCEGTGADLTGHSNSSQSASVVANAHVQQSAFETFAEFFSACEPRTEKEKALLAAYWIQIENNQSNFPSQALNTQLKDLGHQIGNITEALTALKNERPSLALQIKKSGSSRQARKTYKLTQEGIKRVKDMLTEYGLSQNQN